MVELNKNEKAVLKRLLSRMSFFELLETFPSLLNELGEDSKQYGSIDCFKSDINRVEKALNCIESLHMRERLK